MNHGHVLPNPNGLLARCGGPACLDLFCGAGGMAVGYHRAGFLVRQYCQQRPELADCGADHGVWINEAPVERVTDWIEYCFMREAS